MDKKYRIGIVFLVPIILVSLLTWAKLILKPTPLNVILITIDALRADHLGCYGYKRNTSPHIDNLAREGALFTQAISLSTQTTPSLTSLFSSTYLSTNRVFLNNTELKDPILTLPQILKQRGYYTGFISGHGSIGNSLKTGFDTAEDQGMKADLVTTKAISWMIANQGKPFLLCLHYFDTHAPYNPPDPYKSKYLHDNVYRLDKKLPLSLSGAADQTGENRIPSYAAENGVNDVDYYIAHYDGAISFIDYQINDLLKQVKGLGLDRHTLIVITADHGENLGEHNLYFLHGGLLDSVLKVPLILKCDGIIPSGQIIPQQVSAIDLVPTILAILKIKCNQKMEGSSLFLRGNKWRNRPLAFSEFVNSRGESTKSVRTSQWKLVYDENRHKYQLYNLEQDPRESNDLAGINTGELKTLKIKLAEWMNREKPIQPATVNRTDEESKKRLRSLGYAQ